MTPQRIWGLTARERLADAMIDALASGINAACHEDDVGFGRIGTCFECGDESFLRYCSSTCAEAAGASDIAEDFDLSDDECDELERGAP